MEKDLISIIKEAGIVGAGGAGFPTHVKLNTKADYLIINGAECEPLLRVDQQLMAKESRKLLDAIDLVKKYIGAKVAIIGLKSKYKKAIENIETIINEYENIKMHKMPNFYPAGDEQVLVYETIKKIIPEGSIPLSVGAVVLNVETLLNIYEAYYNDLKVTNKYVTVTGDVKEKITVNVPIGISIKEVIDLAGGSNLDEFVVINGGPMMGKIVSLDDVITKTTKGLIVLPKEHSLVKSINKNISQTLKEAKTSCMHCSLCSEICPRNLLGHNINPHKLIRIASYSSICDTKSSLTTAFLCCECRLCEYACIMNLQPWKLHSNLKKQMSAKNIKNDNNNTPIDVHPFREYKRYPVSKLISKLDLSKYDKNAEIINIYKNFTKVKILLNQHIGISATPIVKKGDKVLKGQLIAFTKEDKLGTSIHSSIEGLVKEVNDKYVLIES
ncbi:4Fe-4S dicluster domain-containing protein [Romboutsia hominis]|uniref:Respiratory-chain NADH dehydrogenase domain, 51 kDa subunit n=1 Tax=Romboutsia hominis TaxID=1507512 RepID=A0A2P2BR24_9FIRM|nr:4Fe-4S dicluster domain-containing protein [Romboutsia hominis]MCH1960136.1 SLBB domain-containing protein [Romboutsia hominis]MCH1969432.1 SLBB domain-containing protein [Romboutsia hominis]CEI72796.1 Respiratory-chain NADH dehydrogenase domain, 51 kDa subunit [Romboutsia hominis]